MAQANTDKIEKRILLRAPRSRVWRALSDAQEFGSWFGVQLAGRFEPGARVSGKVTHPGYEHLTFKIPLERRAKAFELNDEGWGLQMKAIERHVAQAK